MKPQEFYDLLLDYSASPEPVTDCVIGLVWTLCSAGDHTGLAMSPAQPIRTLPWSGTVKGKSLSAITAWVRDFEPYRATVGMAAFNAATAPFGPPAGSDRLEPGQWGGNLAVFEHFLPAIKGKRCVVVGRYPGLAEFAKANQLDLTVLERNPGPDDLPDTAAEFLLTEAEWVFLTASSIANKTFPRLADLSRDATTVLMGPTTPWLPEFVHFGIDYLAGVAVHDRDALHSVICEGGGVRLFDEAVRYHVAALTSAATQEWTRTMITKTAADKERLQREMDAWYAWYGDGKRGRYPGFARLDGVTRRLSRLDTCFKTLWDSQQVTLKAHG